MVDRSEQAKSRRYYSKRLWNCYFDSFVLILNLMQVSEFVGKIPDGRYFKRGL